jgi:hypothetical protein
VSTAIKPRVLNRSGREAPPNSLRRPQERDLRRPRSDRATGKAPFSLGAPVQPAALPRSECATSFLRAAQLPVCARTDRRKSPPSSSYGSTISWVWVCQVVHLDPAGVVRQERHPGGLGFDDGADLGAEDIARTNDPKSPIRLTPRAWISDRFSWMSWRMSSFVRMLLSMSSVPRRRSRSRGVDARCIPSFRYHTVSCRPTAAPAPPSPAGRSAGPTSPWRP